MTTQDREQLISGIIEDEVEECIDDASALIRDWLRNGLCGFESMDDQELLEYASAYCMWGEPEEDLHPLTPLVRRLCAEHLTPETHWLKKVM